MAKATRRCARAYASAYIVRHHKHNGGRYDVLLQGLCRAAIADEMTPDTYR